MATPIQLLEFNDPYTKEDMADNPFAIKIPDDILQLQADVLNVIQAKVPIESFDPEYQERIKNYYKYSATVYPSKGKPIAKRTTDTMDII